MSAALHARDRIRAGVAASRATLSLLLRRDLGPIPALGPQVDELKAGEFPPYIPVQGQGFQLVGQHLTREASEWSAGINHYIWHGPCDGFRVAHSIIEGGAKWASRSYRMRSLNTVEWSAFLDTYPEHDLYWNIAGYNDEPSLKGRFAALFRGLYFERTGGQNIQLVQVGENRRFEEGFDAVAAGDWTQGGPIIVSDVLSRDAGWLQEGDHVRSAFALSFFETKNNLFLVRAFIDKTMQPASQGCLLIEGHERAVVKNSVFLGRNMRQPLALVKRCQEVIFDQCVFQADEGQTWVDIEDAKVTFRGCLGSAGVNANRKQIGSVARDATHDVRIHR